MDHKLIPLELEFTTLDVHSSAEPFGASSTFKQKTPEQFEVSFIGFYPT